MFRTIARFIGRAIKAAFRKTWEFIKSTVKNSAGIVLLGGAAVGFTKLATELPFQIAMPLWIESMMVAPVIGVLTVMLLVYIMKWQLRWQGVYA